MSYIWRVSHQRTITEGADVLVVEQLNTSNGVTDKVYIPPGSVDLFTDRVQTCSARIKRQIAWKDQPQEALVTKPKNPRYRSAWTVIVDTLKGLGMLFEVRGEMADTLVDALANCEPPLITEDD